MAAMDQPEVGARIEPPCPDGDNGVEPAKEEEEEYSGIVERLRFLVFGEDQSINIDEIRRLIIKKLPPSACGVEDAIAPIRANLWSAMLLGLRPEDLNSQHELVSSSLHGRSSKEDHAAGLMHFPKEDQRVLAADIKRTRQAYAMFKREEVMQLVSQVLERYCVGHGIRYKQGQNELIAPFVMLKDPPLPLPVLGLLFESFMSRFVSRWFVDDEIEALLVSYRVFRVLLFYVDPGLANKLDEADFVPELYATAWLITLFSRNLSMELVVRLWDVYLAVNDPALVFFLLAALLVRNRDTIMTVDQAHMMPETVQSLTVTDKEDLEELIIQAREMLRKIPGSFLQTVRSCCSDQCNAPLDTSRSLFCESVRCASISPGELLERMSTRRPEQQHAGEGGEGEGRHLDEDDGSHSPCPMRPGKVDTVALDIRPLHDYEKSGVGHLGKSLRLDPYLLEMEDVLEKWLEHFDGTRGTHVCLVDSLDPTTAAAAYAAGHRGSSGATRHGGGDSGSGNGGGVARDNRSRSGSGAGVQQQQRSTHTDSESNSNSISDSNAKPAVSRQIIEDPLWRRLLFGEGETTTSPPPAARAAEDGTNWANAKNSDEGHGIQGQGRGEGDGGGGGGLADYGFGAARAFAQKLHARGFPYVSILEGGMEGIVEHLKKEGSPLEPTVIDHDPEAYQRWREAQARKVAEAQPPEGHERTVASRAGEAFSWRGEGHGHAGGGGGGEASSYTYDPDAAFAASYRENGQQQRRREGGGEYAGEDGGGEALKPGQARVGVLDRLGLVRVRDGVSLGVGTVARTGAWAVRGGAGMILPSSSPSVSADNNGDGTAQQPERSAAHKKGHVRTESGNIWEGDDEDGLDAAVAGGGTGGGGSGLNAFVNGGLVDSNDVKAIFGAMKTAQAGVRDGITRGVGTVRRTGAWAVREGAGRMIHPSAAAPADGAGATTTTAAATFDAVVFDDSMVAAAAAAGGRGAGDRLRRAQRGSGGSRGAGGGSGGVEAEAPAGERRGSAASDGGGGDDGEVEGSDEDKLLVALKTAEANGHIAVAKVLRGRLGFVQGQALRARLAREKSGGSVSAGGSGGGDSDGSGTAPSSDKQSEETVAP